MDKRLLLRQLAEHGYNVGFGAKKHFATYDIVEKAPGWISFTSIAAGIIALFYDPFAEKWISAAFVILGVSGLYINFYDHRKQAYADAGNRLIQHFNNLRDLYYEVQSSDAVTFADERLRMQAVLDQFYQDSIPKQICFSDWYAHYKFFWQHQIEWIDEQKHFRLFRDKVPLSAWTLLVILFIGVTAYAANLLLAC